MDENIHTTFGCWIVTTEGDLINQHTSFHITFDRLTEQNWFLFAIGLGWDLNEFFPAYYEACQLIGLDSIIFQIKHP
ncbi:MULTISPECIES: hypothetical protein [unclassified Arcicella]|uniref:hypothetical protein n=1 Tax=unclassified Arcicella TaxID=2644986 RepID=UPI002861169F|nr:MULTISPECIES: hypothetical protein [unclassified Arcicella]MDR6564932.1 hypothetical protein [Arcicella sp. BE51]MDR6814722.1 hypothetical protein [Arcicella sp. BE140]MDR6826168.1 hypothetical protein [Arcicella sp. BE139]